MPKFFVRPISAPLCLLLLFNPHPNAHAAAWLQPPGNPLLITTSQWSNSCKAWNSKADLHGVPCAHGYTLNPYFEYGINSHVDIGQSLFMRTIRTDTGHDGFSVADWNVFSKFALWKHEQNVLSGRFTFNIPFEQPDYDYQSVEPHISPGQYWVEGRLLYGTAAPMPFLSGSSWFLDLEAGYQQNFNGAADQINLEQYMGWRGPKKRWLLEFKISEVVSMNNASKPFAPEFNSIMIMPGLLYWLTPQIGVEVGSNQGVYGTNIRKSATPFIALWLTGQQSDATARR